MNINAANNPTKTDEDNQTVFLTDALSVIQAAEKYKLPNIKKSKH